MSAWTGAEVPDDLKAAHRELARKVLGRRGVAGTAIGKHGGKPCLKVYVTGPGAKRTVPDSVGGYPVILEKTGRFGRL